jgi:hypothetical protein
VDQCEALDEERFQAACALGRVVCEGLPSSLGDGVGQVCCLPRDLGVLGAVVVRTCLAVGTVLLQPGALVARLVAVRGEDDRYGSIVSFLIDVLDTQFVRSRQVGDAEELLAAAGDGAFGAARRRGSGLRCGGRRRRRG